MIADVTMAVLILLVGAGVGYWLCKSKKLNF